MNRGIHFAGTLTRSQLGRIHGLWRRWTQRFELGPEADRALRHYFVRIFSQGRAAQTLELSQADAKRVVGWLERLTERNPQQKAKAAGTAGRRGYPERRRVRPTASAWRALWAVAAAIGMNRAQLNRFIHDHYGAAGLRSTADLRTMADLNRVLWGLKAILRRGPRGSRRTQKRAA